MWWFVAGMGTGFIFGIGLFLFHRSIVEEEVQREEKRQRALLESKNREYSNLYSMYEGALAQIRSYEADKFYREGYAEGRNDPKRDVEMLAETLTKTGTGVVKFSKKKTDE